MNGRKHLFDGAFWLVLLLLTLALSAWAIFTRSKHEQVSVQAQPVPVEHLTWKVGAPRISTGLSSVRVTGNDLFAYGWQGAQFRVYVFAASRLNALGVAAGIDFKDLASLSSDDDMQLDATFYFSKTPTWRSLIYHHSVLGLASHIQNSDLPKDTRQKLYGSAMISGKDGSKFELIGDDLNCDVGCKGQFADFKGQILLSEPLQFKGPGADGVNKIMVASPFDQGHRDFPHTQGFLLGSSKTKDLLVREYLERVLLTAKEGQLNFNGQTLPLGPEVLLEISFDESTPGQIEISHVDPPLLRINGTANGVRLGGDNLMPRVIERTPWYLQLIIGIVLTFCVERLYAIFGRTKSRSDADMADA